jgi:serine/threonine protein kinase
MVGAKQVGDWIGDRYEVFEVHRGGMSLVYVASDHRGGPGRSVVAIKTLRDELLYHPEVKARFTAECRLWVQLGSHPNIVRALDVEEHNGRPHVILELVTGGDLRGWIGTPRLQVPEALLFGLQFCLGMEHAMREGLECHRDIKPGNLLVDRDGTLKITDFGLARVHAELIATSPAERCGPIPLVEGAEAQPIRWTDPRDAAEPKPRAANVSTSQQKSAATTANTARPYERLLARDQTGEETKQPPVRNKKRRQVAAPDDDTAIADPHLWSTMEWTPDHQAIDAQLPHQTRTGLMLGTCPYMAPEQFHDAKSADVRSDIYAFGIVLFEMLAGERPFKGKTAAKLEREHRSQEPPSVVYAIPKRYKPVAEGLDGVIKRCLRKDPMERFASVASLRRALRQVQSRVPQR